MITLEVTGTLRCLQHIINITTNYLECWWWWNDIELSNKLPWYVCLLEQWYTTDVFQFNINLALKDPSCQKYIFQYSLIYFLKSVWNYTFILLIHQSWPFIIEMPTLTYILRWRQIYKVHRLSTIRHKINHTVL